MSELELARWQTTIKTLSLQLNDPALDFELYQGQVEQNLPIPFDQISCTVSGQATVSLFNQATDPDCAGVIATEAEQKKGEFVLPPAIVFSNDNAWLKYATKANFKAGASGVIDFATLGFGFEGAVELSSYVIHKSTDTLNDVLMKDLPKSRFIVSLEDVKSLAVSEALTLQTRGKLSANVSLAWSDVLTNSLSMFSRLLGAGEIFNITLAATAKVSLSVEVEDDYVLVVSRPEHQKLNVGVKKAQSNSLTGSLGASITAKFTDPDAIKAVLGSLVSGLLDQPIASIDAILAEVNYDNLNDRLKPVADKLAKRLHLDDAVGAFTELKTKLVEVKGDAAKAIEKAATLKAEVAFAYDYRRVEQSQMMLEVVMSDQQFWEYHHDVIKGNLKSLMAEITQDDSAVQLKRFLHQQTLEVSKSFGFTFSLGDWSFHNFDVSKVKEVIRTDFLKHQQIAFVGYNGHDQSKRDWATDFNASMAQFSKKSGLPTADEFEYAYAVNHETSKQKPTTEVLAKVVDLAVLWQIVEQSDADELVQSLEQKLSGQGDITFNHSIKLDNDAFNAVLPDLAVHDNQAFGACIGQAMPWDDGYSSWLSLPSRRAEVFGSLWAQLLEGQFYSRKDQLLTVQRHIRQYSTRLAKREDDASPPKVSFMRNSDKNSRFKRDWENFVAGMGALHQAKINGGSYDKVKAAFKAFDDMGNNELYIRALGAYLLTLVQNKPVAKAHCEAVLTISYKQDGEDMVQTIGSGK